MRAWASGDRTSKRGASTGRGREARPGRPFEERRGVSVPRKKALPRQDKTTTPSKAGTVLEKTSNMPLLKLLERSKLTESEHGTLHGSVP